jgi:hypothetical protein
VTLKVRVVFGGWFVTEVDEIECVGESEWEGELSRGRRSVHRLLNGQSNSRFIKVNARIKHSDAAVLRLRACFGLSSGFRPLGDCEV